LGQSPCARSSSADALYPARRDVTQCRGRRGRRIR
jgi:hypothetical protein